MAMNITIDTADVQNLRDTFAGFSDRRFAAGLATALTRTAIATQAAEQDELRDVFDRPTPYTLASIFVKPANAATLEARVGVKDDFGGSRSALKWLGWHISGGARTQKAFEKLLTSAGAMRPDQRAVPGRFARLDAFGNVSRGQVVQILSQLRIDTTAGSTRSLPRITKADNAADRRYKAGVIRRAYTRAGGQYMALPNGRGKLRPGIYQVRQFSSGRADPRPVLIFVTRAQYEAGRFDFGFVARLAVQRNLQAQVDLAMQQQLERLAQKQGGGQL